jgi:hypothetical protein
MLHGPHMQTGVKPRFHYCYFVIFVFHLDGAIGYRTYMVHVPTEHR